MQTGDVRSGWDSNPRALSSKRISSAPRYDRFDTAPYTIHCLNKATIVVYHSATDLARGKSPVFGISAVSLEHRKYSRAIDFPLPRVLQFSQVQGRTLYENC